MKRMQLNLDDDLWNRLHARARSISALLRQAARERYLGNLQSRREAMLAFVGIRRDNSNTPDSAEYVRRLRRSGRIERHRKK